MTVFSGRWDEVGQSHHIKTEDLGAGLDEVGRSHPIKTGGLKQQVGRGGTVPPHKKWWFEAAGGARWDGYTP